MANTTQSTIEFLLRRMQHQSDFPALSETVSAINKIASSEKESVVQLSNSILKDFSLTNKILRLVNAAYYRHASGGNISTVSRAVLVLGFDTVRNIAITVVLFEHLQNKVNAAQLKEEFLRTNLAGILGKDLSNKTSLCDPEQAFICAMFCNLGRLLCHYYFPEETEQIKNLMQQTDCTEESAMVKTLGITFEDMGIEIAHNWGFPSLIINSMRKLPAGSILKPVTAEERLRVMSGFANELCNAVAGSSPDQWKCDLQKLKDRFCKSTSLSEQELQNTLEKSIKTMSQFAAIINLDLRQTEFGRQIKSVIGINVEESDEAEATADAENLPITVLSEQVLDGVLANPMLGDTTRAPDKNDIEAILAAGIQDISNTLVEDYKLNDVLRIILETMYRAKGFRRVILCIRDIKSNTMVGRFGFGSNAMEVAKRFDFSLADTHNIFHAALSKGADILISNSGAPSMAEHIPDWFTKKIGAETFVIFPLCLKSNPVAMIYADCEHAGDIVIPEKELSLLRTLRNQAVLAIKQAY